MKGGIRNKDDAKDNARILLKNRFIWGFNLSCANKICVKFPLIPGKPQIARNRKWVNIQHQHQQVSEKFTYRLSQLFIAFFHSKYLILTLNISIFYNLNYVIKNYHVFVNGILSKYIKFYPPNTFF